MTRDVNPLVSSKLPSLKWLDSLEKLAAALQESDPELWAVFEPARKVFSEKIYGLDHWGKTNILHQTANEVLRIAAAEIPKSHAEWMETAANVWRRAPEEVSLYCSAQGAD